VTNFADNLTMLLSTDWFQPFWNAIGLSIDEPKKEFLQKSCRKIVSQILGGAAEYWLTSFSDDRCRETEDLLRGVIRASGAGEPGLAVVDEWIATSDEDLKAGSLFDGLTEDLVSDRCDEQIGPPDPAVGKAVAAEWTKLIAPELDFEELCAQSKSTWDKQIRQLTPDLPTYIANTLSIFIRARHFKMFWASIQRELKPEQIKELVNWYRSAARRRAQRNIAPSYFPDQLPTTLM